MELIQSDETPLKANERSMKCIATCENWNYSHRTLFKFCFETGGGGGIEAQRETDTMK